MARFFFCLMIAVFFTPVAAGTCAAGGDMARQRSGGADAAAAGERMWFYNHYRRVPPDYVYRTGRIWGGAPPRQAKKDGRAERPGVPSAAERLRAVVAGMAAELVRESRVVLPDGSLVAVASFVNLNDLYRTSSLGRYLGEEMLAGLHRAGAAVVEVRKTVGLLVRRKGGEYGLSRDLDQLDPVRRAQAVVVGTYVADGGEVMVNARLLNNSDGRVLATAGAVLRLDGLVRDMLADEGDGDLLPRQEGGAAVRIRQVAER